MEPDDAIQEGSLGFLLALDTYDPTAGKLDAYAALWAKSNIGRTRGRSSAISVGTHSFNDVGKVARTHAALVRELGQEPTTDEVGEVLGFGPLRIEGALSALGMVSRVKSISTPAGGDGGNLTLGDTLADEDERRPDVVVLGKPAAKQARAAIVAAAASLSPRRLLVLRHRLIEGRTLNDVGIMMGVTRCRIQQIETDVIAHLGHALGSIPRLNQCFTADDSSLWVRSRAISFFRRRDTRT